MRGQDLALDPQGELGEDQVRAAKEAARRERGRRRLRAADFTAAGLAVALVLAIVVNALVLQAPPTDSPLPPHRPHGLSGAAADNPPRTAARASAAASSSSASAEARSSAPAATGSPHGTLGYLVMRTSAVETPAPAASATPAPPAETASVRSPLAALGSAPEVTGAVRPPVDVPGSTRILAVQRTLSRLGYGPLKVDGQAGAETRLAIQRFQHDRNLPQDGQISQRLVRELASVSGQAID